VRQGIERNPHAFFALRGVEAIVAAVGRVGNVVKILGCQCKFVIAPLDADPAVAGDLNNLGCGSRFMRIVDVRLVPNHLHHMLRGILGRNRSQPEAHQLGQHTRPKMSEQPRVGGAIVVGAHCDQKIVQFAPPRARGVSPARRIVDRGYWSTSLPTVTPPL